MTGLNTNLAEKSTDELENLRSYLMSNHKDARKASSPAGNSQMDKRMKDILDKARQIDQEIQARGGS